MSRIWALWFPLGVVLLGFLAACVSTDPVTTARIATLSPIEADPASFRVLLNVPEPLEIARGGANLTLTWNSSRTPTKAQKAARLTIAEAATATGGLSQTPGPGEKLVLMTVASDDVPALRGMQQEIRNAKARGDEGHGSLSVSLSGGCWRGALSSAALPLSLRIWLQTAPNQSFLPVVRQADLRSLLGDDGMQALGQCP
ncbi:hypothetical protein [Rhizobium sp. NRK18]|uniref:hypothetical protein n=1 Tax=Rhizobium sp. NRK18 TaxID=2964667 RepID=UPI0021C3CC6C|nr:hypothetical protein [Rhizobium sp. NRK18]MCQ2005487.1 hypothetical protein [Rhizobium sp. NRK18]